MLNLFVTIILEIVTSLQFTRVLEFAAIIVVLMLFSSPGTVFGTVGVGLKAGIAWFFMDEAKAKANTAH